MFVTAVCFLFLLKLKWPKNKNIYDFPKSPKVDKSSLNMSTACLLKKIDAQYALMGKRGKTKREH